jgi:tetratricopeptide (TPR) repeat protein
MSSRSDKIIALSVLIGALLVRLAFVFQTRHLPYYYHQVMDAGFFHQWAVFKNNVSWFDLSPAFREPLYATFLASVYAVLRESLTVARIVQAVLGSLTALMVYGMARSAFGRLAGAMAGVIFALSTGAIFFAAEINETTLLVFLLVSSAYLLLEAQRSRPYTRSLFSGIILGAAFLTRFASVVALPAWVAHLLVSKERRLKQASLLMVIGFAILPAAYQVLMVRGGEHTVVPLRSSWQAFLGDGSVGGVTRQASYDIAVSTDQGERRAIVSPDWTEGQSDALRLAGIERGRGLSFSAASAHWRGRALSDLGSHPGRYLKVYLTKLGVFWGASEPPANIDSRYVARHSFLLRNLLFSFAVIAALGIVGTLRRRGASMLGPALFIPLYSLVASIYLVTDSDKMVVIPFLALFAGPLVGEVISGLRGRGTRRAVTYLATAAIVLVILLLLPRRPADEARQMVMEGGICREDAMFDKAEAAYREAIAVSPGYADAYISLSRIYSGAWKPDQALAILDQAGGAAAIDPRFLIEKANLLFMLNRPTEAVEVVRPLEASYPFEARLHEVMGISLLSMGDMQGAIAELQKEIDYTGGGFITFSAMGRARLETGEYGEAAGYLEQAMRFNATSTTTAMQLADAYNKLGQPLKACDVLARVLSVDPGNVPLRFKFANSLYKADRYPDALKQFKELTNFDPRNADVALNMGTVYAAMDSTALAIEMWEKALTLDPTNQLAKDNLKEARKAK